MKTWASFGGSRARQYRKPESHGKDCQLKKKKELLSSGTPQKSNPPEMIRKYMNSGVGERGRKDGRGVGGRGGIRGKQNMDCILDSAK